MRKDIQLVDIARELAPGRIRPTLLSPPVDSPAQRCLKVLNSFGDYRINHLLVKVRVGLRRIEAAAYENAGVVQINRFVPHLVCPVVIDYRNGIVPGIENYR